MADKVEVVLDAKADLGEGAIWHSQKGVLYWVDIDPGLVHVYDPKTGKDRSVSAGQAVGTVVPPAHATTTATKAVSGICPNCHVDIRCRIELKRASIVLILAGCLRCARSRA